MKIDKIEHLMNPLTADKKGNTHKAGGVDFQKIFEEIQINQAGEKQKLSEFGSVSNAVEVPDGPLGPYSFPPLSSLEIPDRLITEPSRQAIEC